ncbi:MAG: Hpt domain-containing protein [Lachnospiraceae bacterium]|nr:Hpt domain-containing protein [Lachnospiraceae bacterium]
MSMNNSDTMVSIFYEECLELIENLEYVIEDGKHSGVYNSEQVQEMFRCFHTLKADATMMLYENMSELTKSFERILYYYRDEKKEITEIGDFTILLDRIMHFLKTEVEKVATTGTPNGDATELIEDVRIYLKSLTNGEQTKEAKEETGGRKQVYYIAGKTDDKPVNISKKGTTSDSGALQILRRIGYGNEEAEEDEETFSQKPHKKREEIHEYDRNRHTIITETDIDELTEVVDKLKKQLEYYEDRLAITSVIAFEKEDLVKIKKSAQAVENWIHDITTTDFTRVAMKMRAVKDEMCQSLGKRINLTISGEHATINKQMLNLISAAMIHILRNSIDHGIETEEERIELGKPVIGNVKINIAKEHKRLLIIMSDDGRGLDEEQILSRARDLNLLYKPEDEFTRQEIYNLIMLNGFSTRDTTTDYSGQGVGMDVVMHNISDLGGTMKIDSIKGKGTRITLHI